MNERELTESISLGRVFVFGWLGLAMKKKKETNREYIILNNYITEYKNRNKTIEV